MNWIKNVGDAIKTVLGSARKPAPSIPPVLLLCEIMNRPGLSALALTASTITTLEKNFIKTGVNDDGSENMNNKFIQIVCEETIKHIKENAKVEIAVNPMEISFIGNGGNAGGPVVLTLYNQSIAKFGGITE